MHLADACIQRDLQEEILKKTSYTEELSVKCDFLTRVEINVEEEGRYRKVLGNEALSEELGLQE